MKAPWRKPGDQVANPLAPAIPRLAPGASMDEARAGGFYG